ncbi:MAG: hypothetical protein IPH21_00440 [Flavobacteriales bacterium]|nr:hypothetical protein [Flavobacteriales bacterium]
MAIVLLDRSLQVQFHFRSQDRIHRLCAIQGSCFDHLISIELYLSMFAHNAVNPITCHDGIGPCFVAQSTMTEAEEPVRTSDRIQRCRQNVDVLRDLRLCCWVILLGM